MQINIPFLVNKNIKKPVKTTERYKDLRANRQKQILKENLQPTKKNFKKLNKKRIFTLIFILLMMFFTYILYSYISTSDTFLIKEINFINNNSSLVLDEKSLKKINLITTPKEKIIDIIKKADARIDKVYLRKILPDSIHIEIVENPFIALIHSIDGSFIINRDFEAVETLSSEEFKYTDTENKILNNIKDLNASYLVQAYIENLKPEEKEKFAWSELDIDIKNKFYDDLLKSAKSKIDIFLQDKKNKIENKYKLPVILLGFKPTNYNEIVTPVQEISELINKKRITVNEVKWENPLKLIYKIAENTELIFFNNEPTDIQFKRLEAVISNRIPIDNKSVDLRTTKFVIGDLTEY